MSDDELDRLREEKMKELQEQQQSQEEQVEQQRQAIKEKASKYLSDEARSRLGNVRMARPELAQSVEAQIARLGEMGRIQKVGDEDLKDILRDLQSEKEDSEGNISFRR
ncbi:DNA-binding protein [Candidatus Nanosalina sp. VS9-1]|uniref:DNA-binding protein n=1 Tax=Candidatus Nanosalina sp. VS9-1 TaxID=3388566 RepID=UPI0039E1628E